MAREDSGRKSFLKKCYNGIINWIKKLDIEKSYIIGLLLIGLLLIVPMYIAGFYNVISHSDDFGHALNVHLEWMKNPSFGGFLKAVAAAWDRMVDIYFVWGGNYTSFFFSAFQPIAFSEKLNFVGPFIFLTCFIWAEYNFLKEIICCHFGLTRKNFWLIFLCVVVMETQWLTSSRQAFYWYSGCVTNTLGFAGGLAILRIILKGIRENCITKKTLVWGLFLGVFVGGCNYSSMMSLFCIIVLLLAYILWNKELATGVKCKIAAICTVLFVGGIISIIAPGNTVRQQFNEGTNALNAIIMAIQYGKITAVEYFDYKNVIYSLLILPFVWNELDSKKEYRLPLLLLIVSCGIFCAAFAPTMKSDMSVGNKRTRNLYWYIFLNMYTFNFIYFLGWCKHKLSKYLDYEKCRFDKKQFVGFFVAILYIFVCCFKTDDVKYMPGVRCGLDLVTGRFATFKEKMDERNKLFYSDEKEITVKHIDYLPYVILEQDGLFANEVGKDVMSDYYKKDKIHVVE